MTIAIPVNPYDHIVGLFVATFAHVLTGGFFYNVDPFRSTWQNAMRWYTRDPNWPDVTKYNFGFLMGQEFVVALIRVFVALHVLTYFGVSTLHDAVITGFWLWLGLILPVISHDAWQGLPFGATFINQLCDFVRIVAVCFFLTLL